MTETSVPKGAIRRCEIQGRNDIGEKRLNMIQKMILKQYIFTGNSLPCSQYCGGFLSGYMLVISLKIAPKHDTKNTYPSILAVAAEMGGFFLGEFMLADTILPPCIPLSNAAVSFQSAVLPRSCTPGFWKKF